MRILTSTLPKKITECFKALVKFYALLPILCISSVSFTQRIPVKLIQFGWDYPDISQLYSNLSEMQNTPYDGFGFSLQRKIPEAFDTSLLSGKYLDTIKLKQVNWGKYKNNFIILRGFSKTGPKWFNDTAWNRISINLRALSATAAISKNIRGILFDPEYYYDEPLTNSWTYNSKQYPNHSFKEVKEMVKKRGRQFIQALQTYKPNLDLLSLWIGGLVLEESKFNIKQDSSLQALLPAFFEGIVEGKKTTVTIIDGNQLAYWYTKPSQFLDAVKSLRANTATLLQSETTKNAFKRISIGQPIFYDGIMAKIKTYDKGVAYADRWKWLEENVKYAMTTTDEIVWFYSQRIVNWKRSPEIDSLFTILNTLKTTINNNILTGNKIAGQVKKTENTPGNLNTGKGYYYTGDKTKPMLFSDTAFSFSINRKTNNININFLSERPAFVELYINNKLIKKTVPQSTTTKIKLPFIKKGLMTIYCIYSTGKESSAIQVIN